MKYEWDEKKRLINIKNHGIDFLATHYFDWDHATIFEDVRLDYSERRFIAYGYIKGRLVVIVYTFRSDLVRVISLRKANKREVNKYA